MRRRRHALVLAGLLVVAGCSSSSRTAATSPEATNPTPSPTTGPTLLVGDPMEAYPSALIEGVLTVNGRGCFAVTVRGERWALLAPDGSEVFGDGSGVAVPGLGDIAVGDRLRSGGGYVSDGRARRTWADCLTATDDGVVLLAPGGAG